MNHVRCVFEATGAITVGSSGEATLFKVAAGLRPMYSASVGFECNYATSGAIYGVGAVTLPNSSGNAYFIGDGTASKTYGNSSSKAFGQRIIEWDIH